MKKIIAVMLVLCLGVCLLAGCQAKKEPLKPEDAIRVIAADLGVDTGKIANAHVHVAEGTAVPAYSIYFSVDGVNYHYVIDAADGRIITAEQVATGHSH